MIVCVSCRVPNFPILILNIAIFIKEIEFNELLEKQFEIKPVDINIKFKKLFCIKLITLFYYSFIVFLLIES